MEILGIPIGDRNFVVFWSPKNTKAKVLLSQLEEVGIVILQVALIFLCLCGAFCTLNDLLSMHCSVHVLKRDLPLHVS